MSMPNDNPIALSTVVSRKVEILTSELGDELVMLDIETGFYHGLNEIGGHIWGLLQEPIAVADLYAHMLAEYEVEPEACQDELLAFLKRLHSRKLLHIHSEG